MIGANKMREIVQLLLKKAHTDQVRWNQGRTDTTADGTVIETLLVYFPKSKFRLQYGVPRTEPNFFSAAILTDKSVEAGELKVLEPREEIKSDAPDWQLLSDLWSEGRRYLTGWDKALSDMEASLKSEGTVGLPPTQATTSTLLKTE